MAIQGTSNFQYNNETYINPYFRLAFRSPSSGQQTLVNCFLYYSRADCVSGSSPSVTCLHLPVSNTNAPSSNEYELYINQQITGSLKNISPGSTFQIMDINA